MAMQNIALIDFAITCPIDVIPSQKQLSRVCLMLLQNKVYGDFWDTPVRFNTLSKI